ncbi:hypothetical protein WKH56_06295 [Priestia sp. SB1]|uniref:hypothetical protein n=1 Tax=Priestia sp. SB1 TaxID=3132359 RepID=UPI003181FD32
MKYVTFVIDPFGKVVRIYVDECCNGLKTAIAMILGTILGMIIIGLIFAFVMDKIYEFRTIIITLFSVITPLIIILGRAKISTLSSFLNFCYKLFIAPLFVIVMYTGITYKTTWFDNIDYSSISACIPFLLYLFLFPVICWYISAVLGGLVELLAGIDEEKKSYS